MPSPDSSDASVTTLAILSLSELSAFHRMATDAQYAPTVRDSIDLSRIAGRSLAHFEALTDRIEDLGGDLPRLLAEAEPSFTAFRERTKPKDWYESLMKGYVYDGIMKDFSRAALGELDEASHEVAVTALNDTRQADYLRERLAAAVAGDPVLASRLALWGRKLVAETLHRVRELTEQFPRASVDSAELTQHALSEHSRRMSALGLVA
ncbi:hypothetical protein GSY69_05560 [Brevibacterium sp. 5221]|uniref:Ferritin-like domain-containing protein n=1 Tax=Brevibacterium rongguiense TaxID=2695267 RepID=A0A6N9H5Z1_9MICO|nr:ferritin-like fold-containing protein [Brevibacterium rongguiense]MYM19448.1 hypothetical protein [Brevibacterium rongguiense]